MAAGKKTTQTQGKKSNTAGKKAIKSKELKNTASMKKTVGGAGAAGYPSQACHSEFKHDIC